MVEIANVVGSGDTGDELDLVAVKNDLRVYSTEYNPSNYHGLYVRLAENGPLTTIYRSGKYIISGCSSLEELQETNRQLLQKLGELGLASRPTDTGFKVQNVVCTADLHRDVTLSALSIGLGLESTEYEPEQFPGLVYRPSEYAAVLLVFANGKVVITGAPDVEVAEDAFEYLRSEIDSIL